MIIFKNSGTEAIVLNTLWNFPDLPDCDLRFDIIKPSGAIALPRMRMRGNRFPNAYTDLDFREIQPGKKQNVTIDLNSWFRLDEEGMYWVEVQYTNRLPGLPSGKNVWVGEIRSSAALFELVR